jgi:imidazolonepropionase-like amidohydrolase
MPMNLLLRDPAAKGCRRGDHELSQITSSRAPVTLLAAKNAKLNLELGFTTARDLSSGGTADVDLRNAINEGIIPGPRMVIATEGARCVPTVVEML